MKTIDENIDMQIIEGELSSGVEFVTVKEGDILSFYRDAGKCYGSVRKTSIDCAGVLDADLYDYVKEYLGIAYANAIEELY